jgi:hypothetical protein
MPIGRKEKRFNRTFKRTPVWMRSEDPAQIWAGGVRELTYVYGSLRVISGRRTRLGEHPLAGQDLTYEERCVVGAVDAFSWLAERNIYRPDAARLAKEAQALADALTTHDFDAVVESCTVIADDLSSLPPH